MNRRGFLKSAVAIATSAAFPPLRLATSNLLFGGALGVYEGMTVIEHMAEQQRAVRLAWGATIFDGLQWSPAEIDAMSATPRPPLVINIIR